MITLRYQLAKVLLVFENGIYLIHKYLRIHSRKQKFLSDGFYFFYTYLCYFSFLDFRFNITCKNYFKK